MNTSTVFRIFILLTCVLLHPVFGEPNIYREEVLVEEVPFYPVVSSKEVLKCQKGRCSCLHKGETIAENKLCDGKRDCTDASDESLKCLSRSCPRGSFKCSYGACINATLKCNGVYDCDDQSDENLPECKRVEIVEEDCDKETQFRCKSGHCVKKSLLCDGNSDCHDSSDETIMQCITKICPTGSFQCSYGGCIKVSKKCDGVIDCIDGSDELLKMCKPPPTATTTPHAPTTPRSIFPRIPNFRGCILPPHPKGGFYVINSEYEDIEPIPGAPVKPMTSVSVNCSDSENYFLFNDNGYAVCIKGQWRPSFPKCSKYCSRIISSTLDIECLYRGDAISCEHPVPSGTKAIVKCKPSYSLGQKAKIRENVCLPNGEWERSFMSCTPDCGMINYDSAKALISYGIRTKPGQYPWFVAMYQEMENNNFEQICGGTIISAGIVLTAAHCVYREETGALIQESLIKVAAGKVKRGWNEVEPYVQKRDVKQIIIPKTYRGSITSFAQDIALLDLVADFVLSNVIQPACLDCSGEFDLSPGILSTAVGFGRNENGIPSQSLMMASLPVVFYQDCVIQVSKKFSRYMTYDKFCAGYKNGTGVQQGDSGGGLTVPDPMSGLHYVFGIVSIKPKDENTYAAFTNVSDHCKWTTRTMMAIKQQSKMHLSLLHI